MPQHWLSWTPCLVTACALGLGAGCRSVAPVATRVVYGDHSCWHLSNGTVDLVVNPEIGRIVRYGFVGSTNLLWDNPRAAEFASRIGNWNNWGGDKVWPWPQAAWPAAVGRGWPPPGDGDVGPYSVEPTACGLRMTSPALPRLGLRVVREIELARTGSRVTIRNRLEPAGTPSPLAWGAWTITQTAIPDLILARLDAEATATVHALVSTDTPFPPPKRTGRIVELSRDPALNSKAGFDASLLAGRFGDTLFVQSIVASGTSRGTYAPGARAQYYADADVRPERPPERPPYLETELTSPCLPVSAEGPVLTVRWELRRLKPAECQPAALYRLLESW